MRLDVTVPLTITRGQNNREHHMVRAKRVREERSAVDESLRDADRMSSRKYIMGTLLYDDGLGARVTLLRPYARTPLDDDNLSGACKAVRDEVAAFLGVDDATDRIHWRYVQCKSVAKDCNVRIRIEIVPVADVDPLVMAVRVMAGASREVLAHVSYGLGVSVLDAPTPQPHAWMFGRVDHGKLFFSLKQALTTADALTSFSPSSEMYTCR
jgi:hypothetical protein